MKEKLDSIKDGLPEVSADSIKQLAIQQAKQRAQQGKELLISMGAASFVGVSMGSLITIIDKTLNLDLGGIGGGVLTGVIAPIAVAEVKKRIDQAGTSLQDKVNL